MLPGQNMNKLLEENFTPNGIGFDQLPAIAEEIEG